jgi:hypothetical protein
MNERVGASACGAGAAAACSTWTVTVMGVEAPSGRIVNNHVPSTAAFISAAPYSYCGCGWLGSQATPGFRKKTARTATSTVGDACRGPRVNHFGQYSRAALFAIQLPVARFARQGTQRPTIQICPENYKPRASSSAEVKSDTYHIVLREQERR